MSDSPLESRESDASPAGTGEPTDPPAETEASNARSLESGKTTTDPPTETIELTHRPALASSLAAVVMALLTAVLAGAGSVNGLAIGAIGGAVLGAGLVRGHRTAVDVGALAVFAGVVLGGVGSSAVEPTILATVGTVLAWDLAHGAIDLGEQLGRESRTIRLEAVLFVSSLSIGLLSGAVGYAAYVLGAGGQPVEVVVLLVVAGALLTVALGVQRRRGSGRRRSRRGR